MKKVRYEFFQLFAGLPVEKWGELVGITFHERGRMAGGWDQ